MGDELINLKSGRSRKEAARRIRDIHRLSCTEGTLANHASDGTGPFYHVCGSRSIYLDRDIDEWARARISPPIRKASEARRQNVGEAA